MSPTDLINLNKMNWKNARYDGPPKDNQDVLICVSGIYHLAIYKAPKKSFEIYGHDDLIPVKDTIYWTDISVPNKNIPHSQKTIENRR